MKRTGIFVCMLLFVAGNVWAQDPSFSQFYANRIYLNPAFTGLESGMSLAGVSRMQWTNVDGGFKTFGASLELQEPFLRSGFGLNLFHNKEGIADLTTTNVGLSYAYTIPFERHNIHIGMHARWVQKSIDWSKIIFSDQLDPVYGNIYATTHVPIMDRVSFMDFDMGLLWRFDADLKLGKKKTIKNIRNSFGISLHHAPYLIIKNGADESLQNLETRTSPRLTVHLGSMIPIFVLGKGRRRVALSPNFKFDVQGEQLNKLSENLQVVTYGMYLLYDGIYGGILYQNKYPVSGVKNTNALIFAFGAYIKAGNNKNSQRQRFFLGLSYDANTTGVGPRAGGVYELAFRYYFAGGGSILGFGGGNGNGAKTRKKRGSRKRTLDCYDFF